MEETSALNTTELATNSSEATGLPELAVIFAPVLLVQLLLGLVSNLLLIALLVKANSVNGQNNINIYLYSVAINNLLTLFPALTLLISTVTKEWVLGQTMCSLNLFVAYAAPMAHFFLQACISRERYRALCHFSKWQPYSKSTYIRVAVVWISAMCSGVIGLLQGGQIAGRTSTEDILSCYLPNRWMNDRHLLPLVVVYLVGLCIGTLSLLAFSTVHYAYAFKALYSIKEVRNRPHITEPDHLDIPISLEAEVRSLKSMACVFFVTIAPFITGTQSLTDQMSRAYTEVVFWKKNVFTVPLGASGKSFVSELARLFQAYSDGSGLESIALKAITVASRLLLQKPFRTSKAKDHTSCLKRRLTSWKEGNIDILLLEGRTIQQRLPASDSYTHANEDITRSFTKLMFEGNCKAAMRLLTDDFIFDGIDASAIKSAVLQTEGSAGPSGIDAKGWRRLCTSFHSASVELCKSLAALARRLCTSLVDPCGLAPFLACRLIALDKNTGVRPIGICEVTRRIISKAVLSILRVDIQEAAGSIKLCAGQISGTEAAIHAIRDSFHSAQCEAVLLIDANNAFNSLNREAALRNIQILCPPFATILINTYRAATELFVQDTIIFSREGTTQGDPLAMPMYALGILPLIQRSTGDILQVWYADDASATGIIHNLREWWGKITTIGPSYGYYANATKTWLVVKDAHLASATSAFLGTNVNIKTFTHSVVHQWTYLARTVPNISTFFTPIEDIIRSNLIPFLTGRAPPGDLERLLLSLPPRLGGLGFTIPTNLSAIEFDASTTVTKPLYDLILQKKTHYPLSVIEAQIQAKKQLHQSKQQQTQDTAANLLPQLSESSQRSMVLTQEKGASSWLTTLPISEHGFALHKGYPTLRHNEIRNLTANLLSEVCHNVTIEPTLQPVTRETFKLASTITDIGARSDIAADGFWGGHFEKTFFDIRVLNPLAPSNTTPTPNACYRRHEKEKQRAYEQRIREIEHASFTPIVLSTTGGMGPIATTFYKRLADRLASKCNSSYSQTIGWL
ncbi:hypothetical protein EMCRGX_G031714 [Ephydatia muelleri]